MKTIKIISLIVGLCVVFSSCKDDNPLTFDIVEELSVYDLGNNGNASDIRVDFKVKDNLNVTEYRIMVIPANVSSSFNEGIAMSIPETSYQEVNPERLKFEYSIKRLAADVLDVNGGPIRNDLEYVIAVFVFGNSTYQLARFSTPVTLLDQGIYNGRYFNGWEHECLVKDGSTYYYEVPPTASVIIDFTADGDDYYGLFVCVGCGNNNQRRDTMRFTVTGTTISNYSWIWSRQPCYTSYCNENGFCAIYEYGEGTVIDDLTLKMNYTNEDCSQTCKGTDYFIRQTSGYKSSIKL